jgi:hypothetical protein
MKTAILLTAFVFVTGISGLFAQHFEINPIPSYNYELTSQNTGFQEKKIHSSPSREKRDMEVVISSSSTSPMPVYAKVWVVKDNGSVTLGPYVVLVDEQLSVPIDNDGIWGVVIRCDWNGLASVWIE